MDSATNAQNDVLVFVNNYVTVDVCTVTTVAGGWQHVVDFVDKLRKMCQYGV